MGHTPIHCLSGANKPLVHNTYRCHASCEARFAPSAAVVRHVTFGSKSMKSKRNITIIAICLMVGYVAIEQTELLPVFSSHGSSATNVADSIVANRDGPVWTMSVKRPFSRFLPFLKFGETVYTQYVYQTNGNNGFIARRITTHSNRWAIGLCSTARFEAFTDAEYEQARKNYASP